MDPRLQRRVQRYGWDKAATHYEGYWQDQLRPAQDLLLEMAGLSAGAHVLDVACGTGLVTFRAAKIVGDSGHVLGTDISDSMVEAATKAARKSGIGNVSFERKGAEELQAAEATFDVALCALGLMYFPDPVKALVEMKNTLKPSGRTVAAVWGARDRCGWAEIFPIVDSRVQSEVCPLFFQLGTGEALAYAFTNAEYTDITTKRISTILRYDSADSACGAAFAGGPVALAYSKFDAQTSEAAHKEYLDSIASFKKGDGYEIPGEFVVTTGTK